MTVLASFAALLVSSTPASANLPRTGEIGNVVWNDLNRNGIQDVGEAGIDGVTVLVYSLSGFEESGGDPDIPRTTVTTTVGETSGHYLFSGLFPGDVYRVEIDATSPALAGHVATQSLVGNDRETDSNGSPTYVTLASDPDDGTVISDYGIDFGYHKPGEGVIGDFVWLDLNQNGVQDMGELGINGVTVLLKDTMGAIIATTTTEDLGTYWFNGLYAGTYTVEVDASSPALAGYMPTIGLVGDPATDSNGSPTRVVLATDSSMDLTADFGYIPAPAGSIGDFVWYDINGNGLQDADEPGIGGVTVTLHGPGGVLLGTVSTDPFGFYLFKGLSSGPYSVAIDPLQSALNGYVPTVTGAGTSANDSNGNPATVTLPLNTSSDITIDFGFRRPLGVIGDFVWKDLNQDGIQDANEPGIGGVTVILKDDALVPVVLGTAVTNGSGFYQFTDLLAGTYFVEVDGSSTPLVGLMPTLSGVGGPASDSNGSPTSTTLTTDSSTDLTIDFGYIPTPGGSIGDLVWKDLNGNGIQEVGEPGIGGVTVNLYSSTNVLLGSVTTDPYGYYLFTGLVAGTYTVAVDNTQSALTGYTPTATGAGTLATDSNVNPSVVVLATNSASDITIDFGYKASASYGTFTQGGWGAPPNGNNPGALLAAKFSTVYPTGVTIGGVYTLKFTSASAIEKFLPQGGTAAKLTSSAVNPTKKINVLAGQTLALKLNVDFSAAGLIGGSIGGLTVVSGELAGWTVSQVLALCNQVLGGTTSALPAGVTISDLNDIATAINENFDNGTTNAGYLQ